jgi:hypothetical protein
MRRAGRWPGVAAMAALLLAACNGQRSTAPAGPEGDHRSVDPCSLVTAADLEKAMGISLGKAQPEDPVIGEARDCRFGRSIAPLVNIGVRREPIGKGELEPFVERFAQDRPVEAEIRELSGLGEEAYAVILEAPEQTPISQATVFVRSRTILLSVSLNLEGSGEAALEAASSIAGAAVGKL